ncbi:MAG TPA: SIMPL domain-containing protein [Mycobacterium sp.]
MPNRRRTPMMVRWSSTLAAVGLAVVTLSGCDAQPGSTGGAPRQVTVVGSGQVEGVPDRLTVDAGIESVASDITAAMNLTNERQQAVIDALVDAGVENKDISTTQISLQAQYGSSEPASTVTGYRATNTIRVRVAQESASQVLAVIVSSGRDAARINSVTLSIADDSALVRDARTHAFEDARNRAEQYAQLSGLKLGKVVSISETSGSTGPTTLPVARSAMAAPAPIEPGEQTVGFSVTVVWELS